MLIEKVSFFLMGEKGYTTLLELLKIFDSDIIDLIVTETDKKLVNDFSDEIINLSKENRLKFFKRNDKFQLKTKYVIAISWRWIINVNEEIQVITLHDSLLPKYRGFAPLVNYLINNEQYIGVTALLSTNEYDKGNIISQEKIEIKYPIKISKAITKISKLYAKITVDIIKKIKAQKLSINSIEQNEELATYSLWRDEDDYVIDWNNKASDIRRFIDAVGKPYKGAKTKIFGRIVRIMDAVEVDDVRIINRDCGKTIFFVDKFPIIVCGEGLLKITNAFYEDDQSSIFPLEKFRIRFS